ncbi:ABC1 kinase family protein [Streptomyces polyrhachis]|uniref:ABC1 kinase family protein n=1 Tax=Streptomyces polyrhachis TaxID=1282885 RepID=A0ABW2GJW9_9ACTN
MTTAHFLPRPTSAPTRRALLARCAGLTAVLARGGAVLAGHAVAGAVRGDFTDRRERWLVDLTTRLGPAFVKAAQLLATRVDVLPPRLCTALGRLHDRVRPEPAPVDPRPFEALGIHLHRDADGLARPVAAGSIACVHRATGPDGEQLAVKIQRPRVAERLTVDLELMRRATRLAARLPHLRDLPATDIVDQLTWAIHGQLDTAREAANLREIRTNLAEEPAVHVPRVHPELGGDRALVMEYVEDLRRLAPEELTPAQRTRAVRATLHAVYRMLFLDGLVHCDLHPGNLYFRPGGDVVLVDVGFTVRLDDRTRRAFARFFFQMSQGDGERCARTVLSTATPGPLADTDGFLRDLAALVHANSKARAADFDLVSFAAALFDIQRRHGLYAAPEFVFPLLSLLVLEGTVRAFAPDVDFQAEAGPYLMRALFGATYTPAPEPEPAPEPVEARPAG